MICGLFALSENEHISYSEAKKLFEARVAENRPHIDQLTSGPIPGTKLKYLKPAEVERMQEEARRSKTPETVVATVTTPTPSAQPVTVSTLSEIRKMVDFLAGEFTQREKQKTEAKIAALMAKGQNTFYMPTDVYTSRRSSSMSPLVWLAVLGLGGVAIFALTKKR